jgi:FtsP/CotA-like multicopper oxidase with cupredoxin domain
MLANGTVYPEATVEARRYRLRILNACQSRFLNLQLYVDDGSPDGITLNRNRHKPTNAKGPDFLMLGTEGGFLPHPVHVRSDHPFDLVSLRGNLITGPAERWDLLVDFRGFAHADHQADREGTPHRVVDDPAHLGGRAPGSSKTTLGMRTGCLLFAHQSSFRKRVLLGEVGTCGPR